MAQLVAGIKCAECKEEFHHTEELVFLKGDEITYVDEQNPDWDKALCGECAEEKGFI